MRIVNSNISGNININEIEYFGGNYTFWEKLKMKGVGSNRLVYLDGIEQLDLLRRNVEVELVFVNFEILKNGLILRANCNQRIMNVGVRISDLLEVKLVGYKMNFGTHQFGDVHRGVLYIKEFGKEEKTRFQIVTREYNGIVSFFSGSQLAPIFNHSIHIDNSEKDYSHLLNLINLAELF